VERKENVSAKLSPLTENTVVLEQDEFQPLPVWFFLFVGYIAAQYDLSQAWPPIGFVSLAVFLVYFAVWGRMLRRRARYLRAVLRSRKASLLAVGLFVLRMALRFGLSALALSATAASQHLVIAAALFVVGSAGGWFDQWLVLRTLRARTR
jgi:FtsH-binding integral membrane protein